MFMELYKFSKLVMRLNSCSMDLGHDSELVNERSISESIDHSRLVDIRMNKTSSLKKKNTPWSGPRMVCSYIFLLDLYKYLSSWLYSNFFSSFLMIPPIKESSSFYTPFPSFSLAVHV